MNNISLDFYITWYFEFALQRLQWKWHHCKSQWELLAENKEHSPTEQHQFWASTHNAGYCSILVVNRLPPGIK